MPLPTIFAKCFLVYGSDEKQPLVNVLYYRQDGVFAGDQAETDDLAAQVDQEVGTQLRNFIAADCNYFRSSVSLNNAGVVYEGQSIANAGVGGVAGESLPDYAAAIIRKVTAVGGRRGRGRLFIGGIPEGGQNTGRLTVGQLALLESIATGMLTPLVTANGSWDPCHYSRADDTAVQLTATNGRAVLATQRRRRLQPIL